MSGDQLADMRFQLLAARAALAVLVLGVLLAAIAVGACGWGSGPIPPAPI